ncbi:arsenosugar biosynthesis radical SAM (seleno)protein ArsS [Bythopirellula goksoeyrii]|uniref:Molybdenum cofactor biosynthesis protein A n=1 Tax=Bythopirellula goksoeyrii TaxID=1400387 RepID=A0A5B9QHV2_9BACT|nr:arsenosugar biosynthesis radical SAM (seleno)protein ArsS [Bythopirellula goksoeyrii]QEG37242.1 molybdenum cofactor biosynthesis protein A [Bythopirellula goksoeyrii]
MRSPTIIQLSLLRQHSPLAEASEQIAILESQDEHALPTFAATLAENELEPLEANGIDVLQVNVGKLCNQTCRHCHVDAGPDRRESMSRKTAEAVIRVLRESDIGTLDITGGAPEMNSNFNWIVEQARQLGRHVIDRCNLTILVAPGYESLPEFLAHHQVEVVASLPCYTEENCDSQRGDGVFQKSIQALRRLNELGYGQPNSPLSLILVYNPVGPSLPPSQAQLEADYRRELRKQYGIEFTKLYTITNLPISRFLDDLLQSGQYQSYMQKLVESFNPRAVEGVMCRSMLSVDWQGRLYDCDFNQMLELPLVAKAAQSIFDLDIAELAKRQIVTGRHCFGCTAGAGSGCQGSLVP